MGMRRLWDPGSPKQGIPVGVFSIEGVEWGEAEPETDTLKMLIIFLLVILLLCVDIYNFQSTFIIPSNFQSIFKKET